MCVFVNEKERLRQGKRASERASHRVREWERERERERQDADHYNALSQINIQKVDP